MVRHLTFVLVGAERMTGIEPAYRFHQLSRLDLGQHSISCHCSHAGLRWS